MSAGADPSLVLLAHGTADAAGRGTVGRLLLRVRALLPGVSVRLAYAGVARPQPTDVLATMPGPVVVVPCFLAAGYHVRVDVPDQLAALGRDDVHLADPPGPDPLLVDLALDRLAAAGGRLDGAAGPGTADTVVLAAAGSTDPAARDDLSRAVTTAAARLRRHVAVGHVAGDTPRIPDVVAAARRERPGHRVVLATWLLAPGVFHRWLADAGADIVGPPLGDDPRVARVILDRYRTAAWAAA